MAGILRKPSGNVSLGAGDGAPGSASRAEGGSDCDGNRIRNLATMTTLPFGHVDPDDVDQALSDAYDRPLWKVLFGDQVDEQDHEVGISSLMQPTLHWCARRAELGDLSTLDPNLVEDHAAVLKAQDALESCRSKVADSNKNIDGLKVKLAGAADAMLALQRQKCGGVQSDLYKAHKQNIDEWMANKIDVAQKAHAVLLDECSRQEIGLAECIGGLCDKSFEIYLSMSGRLGERALEEHRSEQPVDPTLMSELESVVQASQARMANACFYVEVSKRSNPGLLPTRM